MSQSIYAPDAHLVPEQTTLHFYREFSFFGSNGAVDRDAEFGLGRKRGYIYAPKKSGYMSGRRIAIFIDTI